MIDCSSVFMPHRFLSNLIAFCSLIYFSGCSINESKDSSDVLFRLLSKEQTNITFNNRIIENDSFNIVDYIYVYNGGGVAIGDINNDGLSDIYFTGNMVNDKLYLNKGNLTFEDISDYAGINIPGWSTGVTMVDINHDGLLDIYVCQSGNFSPEKRKNLLFINKGNLKFEEQAEKFGLADTGYSTQSLFFDYDRDGDLDMYLLNHTNEVKDPNYVRPPLVDGSGLANDRLFRNNEKETSLLSFTDVTFSAGILYDGLGLGVGSADINGDGWDDIFVTNDFIADDYLYINNKDGTFSEMSKTYFNHVSHFSMGNDLADFNNDGLIDIITVDMLPRDNFRKKKMSGPFNQDTFNYALKQGYMPKYMRNTLQLNRSSNGHSSFSEIAQLVGVDATDWSWSPLLADFDNDGWKDLFVTNGFLRDITDLDFINYTASHSANASKDSLGSILRQMAKERPSIKLANFIFQNLEGQGFQNVTQEWGLNEPSLSNGAAYADLDNDGDLDIVINNVNADAFVYENLSNVNKENHFLSLRLVGDSLNINALGAKVTLYQGDRQQLVQYNVTRGYQSSMDYKIHFGLGSTNYIDSISVIWPDGNISKYREVIVDEMATIIKIQSKLKPYSIIKSSNNTTFVDVTISHNLNYEHRDIDFNDFNRQFLLPHKHSQQGPGIAVGDIDGDGLDDFFIGGAYNQVGQLFHQLPNGKFKKTSLVEKTIEKNQEDTGVLFFDYDNDGDLDLYIVSGSNEFYEDSEFYQDRLYNNDGYGNFTLDTLALPKFRDSGSVVRAADIDQDGDLDLFIGGRIIPLKYPLPPKSHILINENGKFRDATNEIAPDLTHVGMVTDALWTDYDNDGDIDLIVVGEFMPIQFFKNSAGKFNNVTHQTGLSHTSGWWNSINSGDFDNDGDLDYIVGNLGMNTKYKVSQNKPLTIYARDYDNNGINDPIITYFINNTEYPVHPRDELIRQIPIMKKKFPDYESYAKADISHILSQAERNSSYIAKVFNFSSSYLENKGNGKFELHDLPFEAQFSPVYGILIQDFDNDKNLDVLLTGNDYGSEVGVGRYDASRGTFLKGDGNGNFNTVSLSDSGLFVNGDSRSAVSIKIKNQLIYLFGQNSGLLRAFALHPSVNSFGLLNVPSEVIKAKIDYLDNTKRIQEFYFGSSYLSQSSRVIQLSGKEKKITLYDYKGNETIVFPSSSKN